MIKKKKKSETNMAKNEVIHNKKNIKN